MADQTKPQKAFDNSGNEPLYVPGFGCRFDFQIDPQARFLHGVTDSIYPRITAREVAMLQVMDKLTDKPDWRKKVVDEAIVAKWKDEAKGMELISEKAFEWCITELKDRATEGEGRFTITLDAGTRCVKADELVCEQLHHDLNAAIQPLLNTSVKDWHPGSNQQVLNLVHPSMYPLVYGKTCVLNSGQVRLDDILEAHNNKFIASALTLAEKSSDLPGEITGSEINPATVSTSNDLDLDFITAELNMVADPGEAITFNENNFDFPSGEWGDTGCGWSLKYQWLPCDIEFASSEGLEVKIVSYINNLPHRGNEKLYGCIEKLVSISIPLWNEVLGTASGPIDLEDDAGDSCAMTPLRILTRGAEILPDEDSEWMSSLPSERQWLGKGGWEKVVDEVTEYLKKPDRPENLRNPDPWKEAPPPNWADNSDWGPQRTAEWKYNRIRTVLHPEPFFGCTYDDWKQGKARPFGPVLLPEAQTCEPHTKREVSIENTFHQHGLQVIVKIASIELTPEKPTYNGGNWHLEGMLNEHICATAIYYFDVQNVTESRIRYRQNAWLDSVNTPYQQDDHLPFEIVFDVDNLRSGKMIQEVGSIVTKQGRLLVFPNTRQHKVDPFELVDKTRSGHRRFIVLWLVDPHYRVLSTKNVPPQQYHWWRDKMVEFVDQNLPGDVQNLIQEELKMDTMTRAQAEEYRLELMEERTSSNEDMHELIPEYNFCEH